MNRTIIKDLPKQLTKLKNVFIYYFNVKAQNHFPATSPTPFSLASQPLTDHHI